MVGSAGLLDPAGRAVPRGHAPRLDLTPPAPPATVVLDEHQQAVVDHRGGPLLVLAGPGTGKTTTLVEAVAARVEDSRAPLSPEQILVLTFSRKAAVELRDRITVRLGRTTGSPAAWTFHSFCYALLRAASGPDQGGGPRLLSGPEQDVAVRELLAGSLTAGRVPWPQRLQQCLGLRGYADEVRAVLARARELGLDPDQLAALAERTGRDDWGAVAAFLEDYLDVLDARGVLDYSELLHRAVLLAESPPMLAELRSRYRAVFVDEYQDTDPAQERLLRALAGDGRDLMVVGDPDQSIYAFRGADVAGILEFPRRFPLLDGSPAPVRVLGRSRRSGPALLAASREIASRLTLLSLPAEAVRAHRRLSADPQRDPGRVEVLTFPSASAELEAIADLLRREHLEEGRPWDDMAVLVRSGVRSIPLVRRVLTAAGVPLAVAGDEIPLAREPAVAALLTGLRVAADPAELTVERAQALLSSPLCGADGAVLRRLGRLLRDDERRAALAATGFARSPRSSADLLRAVLADPGHLDGVDEHAGRAVGELGLLLRRARAELDAGGSPEEALWILWSGTSWPLRLRRASEAGGQLGRAADRDLDAVCALFDTVARSEEREGHRGARNLLEELEAQRIPGDTLAERSVRGGAVRLLTAHRSKGLEWGLVVVPGVQEGQWPDARRRGSLLEPDRLSLAGLVDPPTPAAMVAEERRLFYVAATRARERLVVSAVAAADEEGDRPSRLLEELGVPVEARTLRARRPLTLAGLLADLRACAADPDSSPAVRAAAARRLAKLAAASAPSGAPMVAAAHPRRWWGLAELSDPGRPAQEPGVPVQLSGSSLATAEQCPLKWFLGHEVRAESTRSTALGFGSVIHALAHEVAVGSSPADLEVLLARLDAVWGELAFEARWQSEQQREAARQALRRLLAWHAASRRRTHLASEHRFAVPIETPRGPALLRGAMDRVERDVDGRVHVVDFKTGKTKPSGPHIAKHPQLAVYQRAVAAGALDSLDTVGEVRPEVGGAELVQLRHDQKGTDLPVVQRQEALYDHDDEGAWIDEALQRMVAMVLDERFLPVPNDDCERCTFRRCCPAQPEGRQVVS